MKKVLFCVHTLTGGGAERAVSVWASKLADAGYDTTLLTYSVMDNEYSLSENVKRVYVTDTRDEYLKLNYLQRLAKYRKLLKKVNADVAISFLSNAQIYTMFANLGLKMKRIETLRISPWVINWNGLYNRLWNLCLKTGDLIIFQNEDQKSFYNEKIQKKSVVIHNTLDEKYEKHGKTEFSKSIKNFVAAGRITEQKNYPMMIEAFVNAHKENPDINLEIYGAGNDEYVSKINNLIEDMGAGDYIKLCGRTSDMQSVMLSKDAFIMSSDYEGMPNALIEAMATGLVCISTDCKTGPRDIIKSGENGFLVEVGNVEDLTDKIKIVANFGENEIKAFGEAARKDVVELCGEKNTVKKLIGAIESL